MSDLIDRQAAIDALENIGSLDTDVDREYARGIFNALPPAQPEYTEQDVREAFNAGYACGMSAARPEWHECFAEAHQHQAMTAWC